MLSLVMTPCGLPMTENATVGLHIFGNSHGTGESIVVNLPNGSWGVIDCCAREFDDPSSNGVLQFLRSRDVTELSFVALTHPHADHYLGLDQLFEAFEVKEFWRPGSLDRLHLQQILHNEKITAVATGSAQAKSSAASLERLFGRISECRKAGRLRILEVSPNKVLYRLGEEFHSSCEIIGIAPSGNQNDKYFEQLSAKFLGGVVIETRPTIDHNLISSAFHIRYGKTRIILGGDVEVHGWADAQAEVGKNELRATLVKVSHHGSTNGYCDDLWENFSQEGNVISVVTPFARSRLPRAEGLQEIAKRSSRLCLTSDAPLKWLSEPRITSSDFDSFRKSRWKLIREFNILEVSADSAVSETGRCSFAFDNDGLCVSEEISFPAFEMEVKDIVDRKFLIKTHSFDPVSR